VIYPQPAGSAARETERRHGEKFLQQEGNEMGQMSSSGGLEKGLSGFILSE
jgi:hypothetical protein